MDRRTAIQLFATTAAPFSLNTLAHHGWSSFDLDRPLYLEGKATRVKWQNPHTELVLELSATLALPADLASRSVPAQTASVDGPNLLKKAVLPKRADKTWEIELAPLSRMETWKVPEIKPGQALAMLGLVFNHGRTKSTTRSVPALLTNFIDKLPFYIVFIYLSCHWHCDGNSSLDRLTIRLVCVIIQFRKNRLSPSVLRSGNRNR